MSPLLALYASMTLTAAADTPILYAGETSRAVDGVVVRTQLNPWEADPARLTDLVQEKGFLVIGANQPAQCSSRKIGMHEIGERVDLGRARRSRQQGEEALADLEAGMGTLACLDEQAEASGVAELFYLSGLVAIDLHREELASAYLRRALTFSPQLSCAPDEPRSTCQRFDDIVRSLQEAPRGTIKVGLGVQEGSVYIDGRRAAVQGDEIAVPEGRHLLQLVRVVDEATVVTSRDVMIVGGQTVMLVNSNAINDAVLREPERPDHRDLLIALAETSYPGRAVYLWSGERAWSLSRGELSPLEDPPPDRSGLRRGLLVAGTTALGVGVTISTIGLTMAYKNDDLQAAEDSVVYLEMKSSGKAGWWMAGEGAIIAGLGAVAAGGALIVGGPVKDGPLTVAFTPTPAGGAFSLRVRR